ncbi:NAD+ synthase (glutamine-hydrolysing) [Nitrosomonas cryotolerans]|uniref:Glutamine-dependent NAD(+) synthetase n=1 Tax=Nitrosomonas cryotolerans ATCC 49181 TaxID=1131553 RepID=A0A1N6JEG1_9PROT|nr:NAD+ synthase [Nitrosomonas cryotolerans]SFP49922.1 NAD+ synthase (glutamine-hydrolysing) [Nitrosomonas cryotolerans]SIO42581.1 NAD+ synthase (glutamine-hydrolysing) [Nitrosomonas cryotolerans ATCC 49181]
MKVAIAQINCTVGDLAGNSTKILEAVHQAKQAGADLIITPELALSGFPPLDLLLRESFCSACEDTLAKLVNEIQDITLVLGHPSYQADKLFNAASVIRNGEVIAAHYKNKLSHSPFFNEQYYFDTGSCSDTFELAGIRFGINICADFWQGNTQTNPKHHDIDILLVLSASSYHIDKQVSRYQVTRQYIHENTIAVIHTNLVGGQDELVFDGASFAMNKKGELTHQLGEFVETLGLIDIQNRQFTTEKLAPAQSSIASTYQALCLGVKDYIVKNRFPGVLVGLSGGIDSALTLAIAVDALGADKVQTVMMPSQYTADISVQDAHKIADLLGVRHHVCDIQSLFHLFLDTFSAKFQIQPTTMNTNTTQENLQARIRGTLLMALSNQSGSLVLTTGNKSEMATGYCTLYGDMAGGFAVLKDISKTMVYQLCQYRNQPKAVIPERIIQRAPSAELRPNQTDQDSLPPYEVLDVIIEAYVERNLSASEIIAMGYAEADVRHIIHLIHANEYKRRQAPLGIRITHCDFGKSWQYPITSRYIG